MNIHIVLFLILFATIINLFYRPTSNLSPSSSIMKRQTENFKFQPQRPTDCPLEASILLFSASGWLCQNKPHWKGDRRIACKNLHALNNSANELVDVLTGTPAEDNTDLFETYLNHRGERLPRYRCHCGSLDDRGNRMIDVTPYQCLPDYCTRELQNVPSLGWNGLSCDCGPFEHADPNDLTSPCVRHANRYRNGLIYGRVECTGRNSIRLLPLLCPTDAKTLQFIKKVATTEKPIHFIQMHLDSHPSVQRLSK